MEEVAKKPSSGAGAPRGNGIASGACYALATGVVAALSLRLAPLLGLKEGYWASISSIIVMQSELGAALTASRDRMIGTLVGGVVGVACGAIGGDHAVVYALAIGVALFISVVLGLNAAGRISGVTVTVIAVIPREGALWIVSLHRVLGVGLGVVMGLAGATAFVAAQKRLEGGAPSKDSGEVSR